MIILDWGEYNRNYEPYFEKSKITINEHMQALSEYGATIIPVASIINPTDKKNFIPVDGHPSAAANEAIAAWMARHIALENW